MAANSGANGATVCIDAVRVRDASEGGERSIGCGHVVNAAGAFAIVPYDPEVEDADDDEAPGDGAANVNLNVGGTSTSKST